MQKFVELGSRTRADAIITTIHPPETKLTERQAESELEKMHQCEEKIGLIQETIHILLNVEKMLFLSQDTTQG